MRTLALLAVLLSGCASVPHAGDLVGDQVVVARLDDAPGMIFECGAIVAYGPAAYTVVDGPRSLLGQRIDVLAWCLGPDKRASPHFRIGQRYRLILTKQAPHQSDLVDQSLGSNPYAFYLRGDPQLVSR